MNIIDGAIIVTTRDSWKYISSLSNILEKMFGKVEIMDTYSNLDAKWVKVTYFVTAEKPFRTRRIKISFKRINEICKYIGIK